MRDMERLVGIMLLAAILCLGYASCSYAEVIYVDDDAIAGGDGTSWQTAYRYLQDALADANQSAAPTEIYLAQGT